MGNFTTFFLFILNFLFIIGIACLVGKKINKGNMKDFDVGTWYKFPFLKT